MLRECRNGERDNQCALAAPIRRFRAAAQHEGHGQACAK